MDLQLNLTAPYLLCKEVLPGMIRRKYGRIINIASIAGKVGLLHGAAYSASKHGLLGLTRTIAKEYGRKGIYANIVVGGYVETAISDRLPEFARRFLVESCPQRRKASAEEVASVALFLASPESSFINGEAIHASGGLVDIPL